MLLLGFLVFWYVAWVPFVEMNLRNMYVNLTEICISDCLLSFNRIQFEMALKWQSSRPTVWWIRITIKFYMRLMAIIFFFFFVFWRAFLFFFFDFYSFLFSRPFFFFHSPILPSKIKIWAWVALRILCFDYIWGFITYLYIPYLIFLAHFSYFFLREVTCTNLAIPILLNCISSYFSRFFQFVWSRIYF